MSDGLQRVVGMGLAVDGLVWRELSGYRIRGVGLVAQRTGEWTIEVVVESADFTRNDSSDDGTHCPGGEEDHRMGQHAPLSRNGRSKNPCRAAGRKCWVFGGSRPQIWTRRAILTSRSAD